MVILNTEKWECTMIDGRSLMGKAARKEGMHARVGRRKLHRLAQDLGGEKKARMDPSRPLAGGKGGNGRSRRNNRTIREAPAKKEQRSSGTRCTRPMAVKLS